ncbi:MAG: 50S ribosomal protein L17 [Kiritimatiellales bacterium]
MRHLRKTKRFGRTTAHRDAMLANQVCSLILDRRIKTTLPKAKAARSLAEKMVTLGKAGTLAARRRAVAVLKNQMAVKKLFDEIAPGFATRTGGYTRISKLGPRMSDASEIAILEWMAAEESSVIEK